MFEALAQVFLPYNMLLMLAGIVGGLIAGALPGFSATMAVALIVPFTFTMNPTSGLITLGAIYMAAIYGGSFSAILINTPGTPSSIGTTFDGYPMAKKGKGWEAIITATVASVLGGLFGVLVLLFLAPPLAKVALRFGPPEYFWAAIFGLTIIASLASKSLLKGIIGGLFGLVLGMIGIDPVGGDVRFTFGIPQLQSGVALIVALIGFFCIPEVLTMVKEGNKAYNTVGYQKKKGALLATTREIFRMPGNLLRSSVIGTIIGIIPGAGGNIANLVAYNEAVRASKHPEKFGTGIIDGVVATETSNNATVGGGLVPLLTLGIPGTPVDAVIYGALLLQGINPGPELFTTRANITYAFILSLFVATILMMPIGLYMGNMLHRMVSRVSLRFLAPSILFLSILGSYAIRNSVFDVAVMLTVGLAGYAVKELGFHPGPITLGLILGPMAEEGLLQATLMGKALPHPWMIFFNRPFSQVLIALSLISILWPLISRAVKRSKGKEAAYEKY